MPSLGNIEGDHTPGWSHGGAALVSVTSRKSAIALFVVSRFQEVRIWYTEVPVLGSQLCR
jgi:hypothetical protein